MNIAVIGASGLVGRMIVAILLRYKVNVIPLGRASSGKYLCIGDQKLCIEDANDYDFSRVEGAMMSIGEQGAHEYRDKMHHGWLIDNGRAFHQEQVPLVIPELYQGKAAAVVVSPNCMAVSIALVLALFKDKIDYIYCSTYQSVSGAGKHALKSYQEKKGFYNNIVPIIGAISDKGISEEESQIISDIRRILSIDCPISILSVRVPVSVGHGVHLCMSFNQSIDKKEIIEKIYNCPYIEYNESVIPTCINIQQSPKVHIGRLQVNGNRLEMWLMSDNVYRGSAWNMCEIAKQLFGIEEKEHECERAN